MFVQVALGAIGVGIVVMLGYIIVQQVRDALPTTDSTTNTSINNAKTTIYSGFALLVVGIIVLAAWGIISLFK